MNDQVGLSDVDRCGAPTPGWGMSATVPPTRATPAKSGPEPRPQLPLRSLAHDAWPLAGGGKRLGHASCVHHAPPRPPAPRRAHASFGVTAHVSRAEVTVRG